MGWVSILVLRGWNSAYLTSNEFHGMPLLQCIWKKISLTFLHQRWHIHSNLHKINPRISTRGVLTSLLLFIIFFVEYSFFCFYLLISFLWFFCFCLLVCNFKSLRVSKLFIYLFCNIYLKYKWTVCIYYTILASLQTVVSIFKLINIWNPNSLVILGDQLLYFRLSLIFITTSL